MANDTDAGNPTTGPDAGPTAGGDHGNIRSPVASDAQAAVAAWTTEAMADAEPYPMPEVSDERLTQHAEALLERAGAAAPGTSDPAGMPAGGPVAAMGDDAQVLAAAYGYPAPFTRFEVPWPYTQYPQVTIGKVFFKQNGGSYVASAASIGNYAILTAGHVVHAGDAKPPALRHRTHRPRDGLRCRRSGPPGGGLAQWCGWPRRRRGGRSRH